MFVCRLGARRQIRLLLYTVSLLHTFKKLFGVDGVPHGVGMWADDAARDIGLGEFGDWSDGERLAVNVHAVYRNLAPSHEVPDISTLLVEMAHLAKL